MAAAFPTVQLFDSRWTAISMNDTPLNFDELPEKDMPYFVIFTEERRLQGEFGPIPIRGDVQIQEDNILFNAVAVFKRADETFMSLYRLLYRARKFQINDNRLTLFTPDGFKAVFEGKPYTPQ